MSNLERLQTLIDEKKVDINLPNEENYWTALHLATSNGKVDVVNLLLRNGAKVNAKTKDGMTALHIAAKNGNKQIIEILLKKGIEIDLQDIEGSTALHIAISNGLEDIVDLLLTNGADINCKNKQSRSALDIATEENQKKIVELLKKEAPVCEEAQKKVAELKSELERRAKQRNLKMGYTSEDKIKTIRNKEEFDKYNFVVGADRLGEGAFGVVYPVLDFDHNKVAAVKKIDAKKYNETEVTNKFDRSISFQLLSLFCFR